MNIEFNLSVGDGYFCVLDQDVDLDCEPLVELVFFVLKLKVEGGFEFKDDMLEFSVDFDGEFLDGYCHLVFNFNKNLGDFVINSSLEDDDGFFFVGIQLNFKLDDEISLLVIE